MAEAFSNKLTRAAGIVTTSSSGSIGVTTTIITGISTVGVAVSDLVDNANFIAGTKVTGYGDAASQVVVDQTSTNTAAVSVTAVVSFLGMTTAYTSAAATKSILIGGTFANNTCLIKKYEEGYEFLSEYIGASTINKKNGRAKSGATINVTKSDNEVR